ncbi:pyridoxal phosphate-dependent aminotransferase [Methanolobus halotolerans]|uniref:Aspartate aminotransferase n=1 Tax=Methanolobus halotolerans TaxID=2052935 RepID=A0A4E0PWM6_9EURY|nr:pyridoxal phosphate-dependent aminotransferase [Methanolobus halotolerans]TGC08958.1 aspartate aminotransferase [Methanolobus halotolerans]
MANPKFAQRVLDIDISGIRKMFEAAGSDAINLGLGQPDFDTPGHIKQAAIEAINDGFTNYTYGAGIRELRQAISYKFERENNFSATPEEVIVTSGASEALEIAIASLVGPGDEVMIADPGFVSYNALVGMMGGKVSSLPLGDDLTIRPEDVVERITPKTKAFIVNSPANPTGAVQSKSDMKAFAEIADDHGITLISDEVYEHFIYEGEHVSPASFSDNVITVNAVSKTYSMTGWRLGYVAARREYTEQMIKVHQYVQACANSIAQKAAVAALEGPMEPVIRMREEFRRRRDILVKGLNSLGMKCDLPKGAFYAFPQVEDSATVAGKLISNGVVVVPGTAFGALGDGYIRLSYAASREDIEKALQIMENVL